MKEDAGGSPLLFEGWLSAPPHDVDHNEHHGDDSAGCGAGGAAIAVALVMLNVVRKN